MQEVWRVLKATGRFLLGFRPQNEQLRRHFPASVYTFSLAEEIRQMLLPAGFHSVSLVNPGASTRGVMFAVASRVQDSAVSDPANNACRHATSP